MDALEKLGYEKLEVNDSAIVYLDGDEYVLAFVKDNERWSIGFYPCEDGDENTQFSFGEKELLAFIDKLKELNKTNGK